MNPMCKRLTALALCLCMFFSMTACTAETDALVKKALTAIAENETLQTFFEEHDIAGLTQDAIQKLKNSIPALKEFLSREDVQEKLRTVALPMIKEFLNYGLETMRLKAETLANIVRIFAPELTAAVDEIFATAPTAPEIPETT